MDIALARLLFGFSGVLLPLRYFTMVNLSRLTRYVLCIFRGCAEGKKTLIAL